MFAKFCENERKTERSDSKKLKKLPKILKSKFSKSVPLFFPYWHIYHVHENQTNTVKGVVT